jgi:hypothetical protein
MIDAVEPGGVLDLQVLIVNPRAEAGGQLVCELDGTPLFLKTEAATAAVDAYVAAGRLVEEAVDDHDARKHYPSGADVADDFADKQRRIPQGAIPRLLALNAPVIVRERCRLRRLQVGARPSASWSLRPRSLASA